MRIETEFGAVELIVSETSWDRSMILRLPGTPSRDASLSLVAPDRDGASSDLAEGLCWWDRSRSYSAATGTEAAAKAVLWQVAASWSAMFEAAISDEVEAVRLWEEAEAEARKVAAEKREAELKAREQRLLTEFLGETIRVREYGKKIAHRAEVEAREVTRWDSGSIGTGKYELRLRYIKRGDVQSVRYMRRVDVQVGSRFETIWDDGTDDLPDAAGVPKVRPYDGGLC